MQLIQGDIANQSYLLNLKGASSNQPCPYCKMTREISSNPLCQKGNLVKSLKNYDDFYEKGEPRLLSDSSLENPINPVIQQLMIVSRRERFDQIMIPGILHFKLRSE